MVIHPTYKVTNAFGTGIVDGEQARIVWENWPPERRGGNPESGFIIWDVHEVTEELFMSTSYIPLPADPG